MTEQQEQKLPESYLEEGYRKGIGIILTKDSKVFIAERSDAKGSWQFPQGGVNEDEDLLEAARRELFEETALTRDMMELIALHGDWTVYHLPEKFQKKNGRGFKGQVQKWFLFQFKESDKVIDLSKAQDKEFNAWKWVTPEEALDIAEDFRKPVYTHILDAFKNDIEHS